MPAPRSGLCRICDAPVAYSGVGPIPTTCSPEHRLQARAADARARRSAHAEALPTVSVPEPSLPRDAHSPEVYERIRERLAAGELRTSEEVSLLSQEDRSALADVLNVRGSLSASHDSYEARRSDLATFMDIAIRDDGEPGATLGDLGYTRVRLTDRGRTAWDSDGTATQRAYEAATEKRRIRAECHREALLDARADAQTLGKAEPDAEALALAIAAGRRRADRLIAALDV